jgi:hypothetical protein
MYCAASVGRANWVGARRGRNRNERNGDGERLGVLISEVCHQLRKVSE